MRGRRLRTNDVIRSMVRETVVTCNDLIYPLFVVEGQGIKEEIKSMPDNYRFSLDTLVEEVKELYELGLKGVLLFGIPDHKDHIGSGAYCDGNIVSRAISVIKENFPDMYVIADVCLCEYTDHGHCGFIEDGYVNNDKTLPLLAKTALSYAKAGADMIAPSDMMDRRIGYIRKALDDAGFVNTVLMSYSAKYCSSFYGPFRDAADSSPKFGDRKTYQMDPANSREAMREIMADIEEGADIIMVKPALPYLDIIKMARDNTNVPICAYNVSGEYSMIKAGEKMGWIDGKKVALESLVSIKRAGADMIITYFAKQFAKGELY
ncbi:MAG: porphobilinogen synthase [Tyzzerella sp.]|uniref:Delta-aminolevulinic acid dehydratase n=1 Tax=Candidatus Fimicola merdigallinarum TaxID=2840819 RepID=A0A9D9DX86_9FIRM|nr:porphobilinogen synthase [Candidatus Fimicola merdigallinarum]